MLRSTSSSDFSTGFLSSSSADQALLAARVVPHLQEGFRARHGAEDLRVDFLRRAQTPADDLRPLALAEDHAVGVHVGVHDPVRHHHVLPGVHVGVLDELRVQALAAADLSLRLRGDSLVHEMSPSASIRHLPTLPKTSMLPAAFTEKPSSTFPSHDDRAEKKDVAGVQVHVSGDRVDGLHVDLAAEQEHLAVDLREGGQAVLGELHVLADQQVAVLALGGRDDVAGHRLPGLAGLRGDLAARSWPATTFSTWEMSLKSTRPSFSCSVTASRSSLKLYSDVGVRPVVRPRSFRHDDGPAVARARARSPPARLPSGRARRRWMRGRSGCSPRRCPRPPSPGSLMMRTAFMAPSVMSTETVASCEGLYWTSATRTYSPSACLTIRETRAASKLDTPRRDRFSRAMISVARGPRPAGCVARRRRRLR